MTRSLGKSASAVGQVPFEPRLLWAECAGRLILRTCAPLPMSYACATREGKGGYIRGSATRTVWLSANLLATGQPSVD